MLLTLLRQTNLLTTRLTIVYRSTPVRTISKILLTWTALRQESYHAQNQLREAIVRLQFETKSLDLQYGAVPVTIPARFLFRKIRLLINLLRHPQQILNHLRPNPTGVPPGTKRAPGPAEEAVASASSLSTHLRLEQSIEWKCTAKDE
jgi:hypothetical protein